MSKRQDYVNKALSWLGTKEKSAGHKQIVADYNKACDRGRKADINTPWCAVFVGAVAQETDNVLKDGYGVPVDCSCGTGSHSLIEKAKKAGVWVENDDYNPRIGDLIIYDWADSGKGDDKTGHDHVGIVTKAGNPFTVTEGNRKDSVSNRTVKVNAQFTRGFIAVKFVDEATPAPAPEPTPAPACERYKVTGVRTNLRIRKEPSTAAEVIGRLKNGQIVEVYGKVNGFARLKNCECYTDTTLTSKKVIAEGYTSLSYLTKV